jgi:hypothetical protein
LATISARCSSSSPLFALAGLALKGSGILFGRIDRAATAGVSTGACIRTVHLHRSWVGSRAFPRMDYGGIHRPPMSMRWLPHRLGEGRTCPVPGRIKIFRPTPPDRTTTILWRSPVDIDLHYPDA